MGLILGSSVDPPPERPGWAAVVAAEVLVGALVTGVVVVEVGAALPAGSVVVVEVGSLDTGVVVVVAPVVVGALVVGVPVAVAVPVWVVAVAVVDVDVVAAPPVEPDVDPVPAAYPGPVGRSDTRPAPRGERPDRLPVVVEVGAVLEPAVPAAGLAPPWVTEATVVAPADVAVE